MSLLTGPLQVLNSQVTRKKETRSTVTFLLIVSKQAGDRFQHMNSSESSSPTPFFACAAKGETSLGGEGSGPKRRRCPEGPCRSSSVDSLQLSAQTEFSCSVSRPQELSGMVSLWEARRAWRSQKITFLPAQALASQHAPLGERGAQLFTRAVIRVLFPERVQRQGFFEGNGRNRAPNPSFQVKMPACKPWILMSRPTFRAGGVNSSAKSKDLQVLRYLVGKSIKMPLGHITSAFPSPQTRPHLI